MGLYSRFDVIVSAWGGWIVSAGGATGRLWCEDRDDQGVLEL